MICQDKKTKRSNAPGVSFSSLESGTSKSAVGSAGVLTRYRLQEFYLACPTTEPTFLWEREVEAMKVLHMTDQLRRSKLTSRKSKV